MGYPEILELCLTIAPRIMNLVRAIERPGDGAAKKAAVMNLVRLSLIAVPAETRKALAENSILEYVGEAIEIFVAEMKAERAALPAPAQPTPTLPPAPVTPPPRVRSVAEIKAKIEQLRERLATAKDDEERISTEGKIEKNKRDLAEAEEREKENQSH